MKKYFYENKKRNLFYESTDRYEVASYILDQACFPMQYAATRTEIEFQNEILEIISEIYVNEIEED